MEAEVKEQEKVKFYNEIEAIVTKHINNFYKNGGKGTIGVYIKELGTNYEYGFNAEKTNPENPEEGYFMTASTCKLLSAAVIYYLDNNNEMELDKTCTDNVSKAKYNLKSLIPRMISHSVNGYFNITLRHLGSQKINEILEKLEVKNSLVYSEIMPAPYTSVKNNIKRYGISKSPRTTPKDLGYVLWLLYDGKTFGAENDKMLTEALKSSIYSNRLPQGIGHKSPVGHKTGTSAGDGVYNDAGIIYLKDNPYIMVVMSRGSGSGVQAAYRSMAMEVYKYMSKRIPSKSETQESKKGFY
ncbi:MAG: serine hydrolase [Caulobacteraceae bacterium]